MKRVLKWGLRLAVIAVLLLAATIAWVYTYEDELKARALSALQEGLATEMTVGALDFSVLRSFPRATVQCRNVLLHDTYGNADTLISAETIGFEVGLTALLRNELVFSRILLSKAKVNLLRDREGRDNYHFWKVNETNGEGTTAFEVRTITLEQVSVNYRDDLNEVIVEATVANARFNGTVRESVVSLNGSLTVPKLLVANVGTRWVDGVAVSGALSARLDVEHGDYRFDDVDLLVAGVKTKGSLHLTQLSEAPALQLTADLNTSKLSEALALLPKQERTQLEPYNIDGRFEGRVTVNGLIGAAVPPEWSVDVALSRLQVAHRGQTVGMRSGTAVARVTGGGQDPGNVVIDRFDAAIGNGQIALTGSLTNFAYPTVLLNTEGDVKLEDFDALISGTRNHLGGRVGFEFGFAGAWPFRQREDGYRVDGDLLRQSRYNGNAELVGVHFELANLPHPVTRLNGRLALQGDRADVRELTLYVGDSDLRFSGGFTNLIPWLFSDDQTLAVDAELASTNLDLASFLKASPETKNDEYAFALPTDIDMRLSTVLERVVFRQFEATQIAGKLVLNRTGLLINPVRLNSCGGEVQMNLSVVPENAHFKVRANGIMDAIDIRRLFFGFEEFGQSFITSANLRGTCRVDAVFQARMTGSLEVIPASIVSSVDLRVDNGELIDLQSMKHISDYMRGNKLIAPFVQPDRLDERLRHIRFETLENRIEINDERIYFPMMDVKSSAMDIKASGSHWFDNRIDYSIAMYLRDILVRRDRDDFGTVEDDGLGNRFFLSMSGTTDNPQFGYDRNARREIKREERKTERENLRQIITEDLNPFKKRSDDRNTASEKTGSNISIEWGDSPPNESPPTKAEASEKKRRWRLSGGDDKGSNVKPPDDDDDDF